MRNFKLAVALIALSVGACSADPAIQLAGPFPAGNNLNPNGTVPLNGDGNYVYNRATGSYSRYSSDPACNVEIGDLAQGCFGGSSGGDGGSN